MQALRAADCHAHVFCRSQFPYAPDATYEPHPSQAGTVARFLAVLDAHGLTHGLLVGAEPHGTDNRCLLEGLAAAQGRLKGIALVKPDVADRELAALADRGVVGVRFNLSTFGMSQFGHPATSRLLARLKEMGWFLQIHCEKDELVDAAPVIRRAGIRVIVDHFGRPDVARGLAHPGFGTLLELGRSGNAVIKLSGPFRSSREGWPYPDVEPFIAAAIEAFTLDHCVWAPTGRSCARTSASIMAPSSHVCSAGCRMLQIGERCSGTRRRGCSISARLVLGSLKPLPRSRGRRPRPRPRATT